MFPRAATLAPGPSRANVLAFAAKSVILSWGWRRSVIALVSGAIGALAMPPFGLFAMLIAPMSVAVWLIDGSYDRGESRGRLANLSAAFSSGWWMGFGYFVAGLWWLGAAFLVEADKFAWALPLGVLLLPAGLAVFWGFGFALARLLWSSGTLRVFSLAFGLGLAEWARGVLFTGFPWNDIGMGIGANLTLAQAASIVGLHGLTFLSIAIFVAPATLWRFSESRFVMTPTALAAVALASLAAFGAVRLSALPSPTVPGVKLRLMQPNVSQGASFAPENKDAILSHYFSLSDRGSHDGLRGVTHLIWPESAFPFILTHDAKALGDIVDFLSDGTTLITGAARAEDAGAQGARYYNSIEVLDRDGLARPRYDKHHLVPFGEYVPFEDVLEKAGVTQFVEVPGGFTPGFGARLIQVPGLPKAMPLICYEAIFPTELGDAITGAERPDWMLNLTDDAWFGVTPGPYQHYAQARLRAIELGLPLVRVANSGVSAVVDGYGRETAFAPLDVETVVDADLPKPLPPTWQSRFGSLNGFFIAFAFLLTARVGKRLDFK